ncbi:MAG: hypothetical protein ABUS51_05465 [Acidobacteriota bacterium]
MRQEPRLVCIFTCLLACLALPMVTAAQDAASDVTVVVDIKGPYSPTAIREMQREATRIILSSGIQLDWQRRENVSSAVFNDLVVMTFKGSCTFDPAPPRYDELGPYAITRTANGEVQPFGEVDCDRVVNSVRTAMFGEDYARGELLIGRALGRVVAHELVHMLTKSGQHGHEGVQKAALSGKQLISRSLPLSAMDVDRLKLERHSSRP